MVHGDIRAHQTWGVEVKKSRKMERRKEEKPEKGKTLPEVSRAYCFSPFSSLLLFFSSILFFFFSFYVFIFTFSFFSSLFLFFCFLFFYCESRKWYVTFDVLQHPLPVTSDPEAHCG